VTDEQHLAMASGSGADVMDWDDEAGRSIGRGAGRLYVSEEEEVDMICGGAESLLSAKRASRHLSRTGSLPT